MNTGYKLGTHFRSTGTAILLLLIPIVNIFIAIWLLVLFFQIVGTSKELSKESGSAELNRYANFRIASFLMILVVLVVGGFLISQVVLLILSLPSSIINNPTALAYYIAAVIAGPLLIITALGTVVNILEILAAMQLKQFFLQRVEGPAREKGMQGASYLLWSVAIPLICSLIGLLIAFISIVGSIIGFILEVMGYFTTGSGFQMISVTHAPASTTDMGTIPAASFSESTRPAGMQQPAPYTPPANYSQPAQENRFCHYCGNQLPPDAELRFCPNCGGNVSGK